MPTLKRKHAFFISLLLMHIANFSVLHDVNSTVMPSDCDLLTNDFGEWFNQEQRILQEHKQLVAQAYWNVCVINKTNHDHSLIKHILKIRSSIPSSAHNTIEKDFNRAIQTKNFDAFNTLFKNLDKFGSMIINIEEKLGVCFPSYPCKINPAIEDFHIQELLSYINDSKFCGTVALSTKNSFTLISSVKDHNTAKNNTVFSIHSISKMFTNTLILILIQEGVIKEKWLNQPLRLNKSVKNVLPPLVIKQLDTVTMKQIMLHQGGFGDYTVNYFNDLDHMVKNGNSIAPIQKLEDFLRYADDTVAILENNETRYSNLGMLLLGLSIEHCYNLAFPNKNPALFEDILHRYIIQPADMKIFSSQRPDKSCWNKSGSCAQYICGSPAGGHWTTAYDLQKFGAWFSKRYKTDQDFKRLLELYGGEFYSHDREEMHHTGGIGQAGIGQASARFSLFLRQDTSVVILSNQPQMAFRVYDAIYYNVLAQIDSM